MPLAAFALSSVASLAATPTSANVALGNTAGQTALVTNLGPGTAFISIGTTNAVLATPATGVAVLPHTSLPLTVAAANSFLAAVASQGDRLAILNIAVGA